MDTDTLTNHISKLGKVLFEKACSIVLSDVFELHAINVDGMNDGGTDFATFNRSGERINTGYQITVQKTAISSKALEDAEKCINKLGISRFYFFTTVIMSESETRKLESSLATKLSISAYCMTPRHIAGLILDNHLLNKFLDESNYPLPRDYKSSFDYREAALHSYTVLSDDVSQLKHNIYDDTILFILSENSSFENDTLIDRVMEFLALSNTKRDIISRRIGALFGQNKISKIENKIVLNKETKNIFFAKKRIYEQELSSLSSSQIDLMRDDFKTDWTEDDSKNVAIWIANATIVEQIKNLQALKASIVTHPLVDMNNNGLDNLVSFLKNKKKMDTKDADNAIKKLLDIASNHPLINKIARASVYLSLEGASPISSAKALGASRWSEFNVLVEP
ncbi:MAG: hypothetical protein ACRC2T_19030, partial [Thermoguttaceae bacterium]